MNILDAMQGRASTRAFINKPVSRQTVWQILDAARWAPSGTNTQPWQVAVVEGEVREQLCQQMVDAFQQERPSNMDYQYYPKKITEPWRSRRFACGKALYDALGIDRRDRQGRNEQWIRNYHGFDAPVEMFVFIDETLQTDSWLDMGMFIQNILLAAREFGLECCAQAAMAEYPDIVRATLQVPDLWKLICGIAIGYPDRDAPENQYRTERESVDSFTSWHGFNG